MYRPDQGIHGHRNALVASLEHPGHQTAGADYLHRYFADFIHEVPVRDGPDTGSVTGRNCFVLLGSPEDFAMHIRRDTLFCFAVQRPYPFPIILGIVRWRH